MKEKTMERKFGHCALRWFPFLKEGKESDPEEAYIVISKTARSIYQGIVYVI